MNTTLRALINQAERLVRTEVYEEAIALCQAVLRRYPRYARCYRILGEAYLGLAEYEEAAKLFRRVLGVDPEDPIAYAGLAIIFEERGLLEEAIWQLERAFELAPGRDELRRELARLYTERGSPAPVQLTRGALARLYARGGLWNKAIGELNDLLAREPYRLDLRVTAARTLWRARRREEAARLAQSILDHAPNCLAARLILGTYWCHEGRDDEGQQLLQGAQELDPENREAARLLAGESPLPLRIARLETEASIPAEGQGEAEEEEEAAELWPQAPQPRAVIEQPPPEGAGSASGGEQGSGGGEDQIVSLPMEAIQVLLGNLSGPEREPDAAEEPGEPREGGQPGEEPQEQPPMVAAEPAVSAQDETAPAGPPDQADGGPADEALAGALSPLSMLQRRVDAVPEDHEARLGLARALVESGELAKALPLYDSLASPASGYLDKVLADLERIAASQPQERALRELMGDAYARAGRFQEAMEMYRWLLSQDDPNDRLRGEA